VRFFFPFTQYRAIISQSVSVGVGTLLSQVSLFLPPMILGRFYAVEDSGIYGTAIRIVLLFLVLDTVMAPIYISSLPRWWEKNKQATRDALLKIVTVLLVACASISFFISVFAKPVIRLVFGDAYTQSALVLQIAIWFGTLTVINTIVCYGLIVIGEKKYFLSASLKGFFSGSALIALFTYFYGTTGAGAGIVVSELCFIIFFQEEFRKLCPIPLYSKLFMTGCCVALAYCALFSMPQTMSTLCKALLGNTIFYTLVFTTRTITLNDVIFVSRLWKQR
jgi:PST family polysaccharide transporter